MARYSPGRLPEGGRSCPKKGREVKQCAAPKLVWDKRQGGVGQGAGQHGPSTPAPKPPKVSICHDL